MFLVDIKVSENNFNDFVRRSQEGVEQAVEIGRVGPWVAGAAERAALLAVRRGETDTSATCKQT